MANKQPHKLTREDNVRGGKKSVEVRREKRAFYDAIMARLAEAYGDKDKLDEVCRILVDELVIKNHDLKAIELTAKISGALKESKVEVDSDTYTIRIE